MERAKKIKIINNYCKETHCSNCKIRDVRRCIEIESLATYHLTDQALNRCIELIGKSIYEHDGCIGCKHESVYELDEPCRICKGTKNFISPEYNKAPDLYEPAEREVSDDNDIQNIIDFLENLKEQLGKVYKYRWHDLRKNPDDLPEKGSKVEATVLFGNREEICYLYYDPDQNQEFVTNSKVLRWREIEPY